MPDAAPAPAAPNPSTAAPPAAGPDAPSLPAAPPAGADAPPGASGSASGDAAKERAAPPGETPEQKRARLSKAGKAARRAAAQNRELLARNQQLEQQARSAGQQATLTQQNIQRLQQLAQSNPVEFAREMGLSPKAFAEAAIRENTPEAQLQAQIRAANERAERAERAVEDWTKQQQTQQQQVVVRAAHDAFTKESGDASTYPNVARIPAEARLLWGQQLLAADRARAAEMGVDLSSYHPTNKQLLTHMEKLAAAGVPAGAGAPQAPPASAPAASPEGSAPPQTVTSAQTSAKYTLPANFDSMSDQEQKHHLARYLESLGGGKKKRNA